MSVAAAARQWQAQGASVVPILANQTKRPAVRWKEYQTRLPELGEVEQWWGNGHNYGLAVLMGAISGNLEMLELEGRVINAGLMVDIYNAVDAAGLGDLLDLLEGPDGYSEASPAGGLHLIYKIEDHPVPGNVKIAQRPATEDELAENALDRVKVLAETRGEGGYVIVAPTGGACHPLGIDWTLINGTPGLVPTITWAQRCALHEVLRSVLDVPLRPAPSDDLRSGDIPTTQHVGISPQPQVEGTVRPGDEVEKLSWHQLLTPAGWQVHSMGGQTTYWTRPGKDRRNGPSATTGHADDRDRLYVFSTSTEFPAEESITKFRAYSVLYCGGDDSAAAKRLAQAFGMPALTRQPGLVPDFVPDGVIDLFKPIDESPELSDSGNAQRMINFSEGNFRWVVEEKNFYHFDGQRWRRDLDDAHMYNTFVDAARELAQHQDPKVAKFGLKSTNDAGVSSAMRQFRRLPGISTSASDLDRKRTLLNTNNGTLNLLTGELQDHCRLDMLTKMFQANYDPTATCPTFEQFMLDVIPDDEMRAYVQRAAGATLLGNGGNRAVFICHGPSSTGKSQFLKLMEHLFGDYGTTAPASTFRLKRDGAVPQDLHRLRGKRFVATSETSDTAQFDEEALKRLTGGDTVSTRTLYEDFQEWQPECDIWIATNYPPRLSSDDDAMWRRAKLIPFVTVFGGSDRPAIRNFAETHLFREADGILNWLLAGLRDFLANGLQEPEQVREAQDTLRLESDPVARFVEERREEDGILEVQESSRIRTSELHAMYAEWCRNNGERPVGIRRFVHRVETSLVTVERVKIGGLMWFTGIGRRTGASILGTFGLPALE